MLLAIAVVSLGATNIYVNHNKNSREQDKLRIVTSFYPMYIAALNVVDGDDSVILENLSEPQTGCLHDYQLTPEDMVLISQADVFIVNGGGIESFLSEIAARYPDLTIINASVETAMVGENAHVWMDMENYQRQIQTIAGGLANVSTEQSASLFENNARIYCDKVQNLIDEYQDIRNTGEKVILFHEAYEYVAREWGLEDVYTLNLDEERQVSAGEIADVLSAVKEDDVSMILAEQIYGEETARSIQRESDVQVLYLDPCVRGEYEKDAYLEAMQKNLKLLRQALSE